MRAEARAMPIDEIDARPSARASSLLLGTYDLSLRQAGRSVAPGREVEGGKPADDAALKDWGP
jgi:hypothetical protein